MADLKGRTVQCWTDVQVYDSESQTYKMINVRVEVNEKGLAQLLAGRALRSKSGRAHVARGYVRVSVR